MAYRHQWNIDSKRRSHSLTCTGRDYRSAMHFHDGFCDRQSHSESAVTAGCRRVRLAKPIEYVGKKIGFYSSAGVCYANFDVRVHALQNDLYSSALWRELDCVRQQVPDDLLQPFKVTRNRSGVRVENRLNSYLAR